MACGERPGSTGFRGPAAARYVEFNPVRAAPRLDAVNCVERLERIVARRLRPGKPGRPVVTIDAFVVLATSEHHVPSTVDPYLTGDVDPIGCTGNHPF